MPSIIIPAYNEEVLIVECLEPFLDYLNQDDLDVIVVCNGCVDSTADKVSQISKKIICIETEIRSKTNALNLGDKVAKYYPRIYLDADVVLSLDAVRAMCKSLSVHGCLATSVNPKTDVSKSSWPVRAFYEIWLNLPYCQAGMIGGIYAISKDGRERYGQFPDVIADDGFVRCLFKENERVVTKGHYALNTAPRNLMSLIKIKTRSRLGRYELKDKFPELLVNETKDYHEAFYGIFFNFKLWPSVFVYLFVNVVSRLRARYQYLTKQVMWERDESTRS